MYCEHEHAECHHGRDFFRGDIRFQEQLHDLNYIFGTDEKHHPCHKEHSQRYSEQGDNATTINAKLQDNAGVLSSVMNELYLAGANILAVNQSKQNKKEFFLIHPTHNFDTFISVFPSLPYSIALSLP